jgi:hypothetical protein
MAASPYPNRTIEPRGDDTDNYDVAPSARRFMERLRSYSTDVVSYFIEQPKASGH